MKNAGIGSFALFLCTGAVYALTLPRSWTWDSMSYSWNAERGTLSALHQHHLIHEPILHALYGTLSSRGVRWRALDVGQRLGICAAALGVALYFSLLARVLRDRLWALLSALALAFSYAYWYWGSQAEVYPLSLLALVLAFGLLLDYGDRPSAGRAAGAGAAVALAILLQQANVLMAAAGLYAVAAARGRRGAPAGRHAAIYLAFALALPAAVYCAWGRFVAGKEGIAPLIHWSLGGAATGRGGGAQWSLAKLPFAAVCLGRSIVNGGSFNQAKMAPVAALVGTAAVLCAFASWPSARARAPVPARTCAIWAAAYGLFAAWWYADLLKFWIAVLAPMYFIIAFGAAAADDRLAGGAKRAFRGAAFLAVAALGAANLSSDIMPARDPARNASLSAAAEIARQTRGGDMIVVPSGMVMWGLRYYDGRPESWWLYDIFERMRGARFRAAAREFGGKIGETLKSGRGVYICPDAWEPDDGVLASKGNDPGEFVTFWSRYRKGAERAVRYRMEKGGVMREMCLYRLAPDPSGCGGPASAAAPRARD